MAEYSDGFSEEVARAHFEQWVEKAFPGYEQDRFSVIAPHNRRGEYRWIELELMWQAWLAGLRKGEER
ncbi:MAG TPA: hypothetical protein VLH80_07190 [Nitrospiraceae bacterium]|nr:hypothetical protein [Nitrospiraceae bacterium]